MEGCWGLCEHAPAGLFHQVIDGGLQWVLHASKEGNYPQAYHFSWEIEALLDPANMLQDFVQGKVDVPGCSGVYDIEKSESTEDLTKEA